MKTCKLTLRATILVMGALFCLASAAMAAETAKKEAAPAATVKAADDEVIAKVNGRPIYGSELQRAKKAYQAGQQIPADKQKEFDKMALNQLVSAELLYQEGRKLTISDLDKQVDDKIAQGKKRFPTQQDFEKTLKSLNMTESDVREYTRRDIVIANYVQNNFASKVTITEEESRKFYDQNLDKFKQPEQVRARHILIGVDAKATDADKKKAREKIETVKRSLAGGSDFAKLAKESSTCPSSQQGGDLGYFGKGQMVPAFEQVAFSLKPGTVSDIVETQFGYHIIKVEDKREASTQSFTDVKPRIDEYLKGQKINAAITAHLEEARKTAKIEISQK